MKNSALETWVWVLIYGGLLLLALGLAIQQRSNAAFGAALAVIGGGVAAVGVLLIWVRSRRKDEP